MQFHCAKRRTAFFCSEMRMNRLQYSRLRAPVHGDQVFRLKATTVSGG
jgi:hypothetical protein